MSKVKRNKRKKRTPTQSERDLKRSCLDDSNLGHHNSGYYQVLSSQTDNIEKDTMATNSTEKSKNDLQQQSYLAFDEKKTLKNC